VSSSWPGEFFIGASAGATAMERPGHVGQNAACQFETVTMTDLSADSAVRAARSLDEVAEAKLAALDRRR